MRYSSVRELLSTGEVQFSWSTGGQVEVGKVRQTADSAGGKLQAAKIATGPLAHCSWCSPPLSHLTPSHSSSFVNMKCVSQDRHVLDVEAEDDPADGVAV